MDWSSHVEGLLRGRWCNAMEQPLAAPVDLRRTDYVLGSTMGGGLVIRLQPTGSPSSTSNSRHNARSPIDVDSRHARGDHFSCSTTVGCQVLYRFTIADRSAQRFNEPFLHPTSVGMPVLLGAGAAGCWCCCIPVVLHGQCEEL